MNESLTGYISLKCGRGPGGTNDDVTMNRIFGVSVQGQAELGGTYRCK